MGQSNVSQINFTAVVWVQQVIKLCSSDTHFVKVSFAKLCKVSLSKLKRGVGESRFYLFECCGVSLSVEMCMDPQQVHVVTKSLVSPAA